MQKKILVNHNHESTLEDRSHSRDNKSGRREERIFKKKINVGKKNILSR